MEPSRKAAMGVGNSASLSARKSSVTVRCGQGCRHRGVPRYDRSGTSSTWAAELEANQVSGLMARQDLPLERARSDDPDHHGINLPPVLPAVGLLGDTKTVPGAQAELVLTNPYLQLPRDNEALLLRCLYGSGFERG